MTTHTPDMKITASGELPKPDYSRGDVRMWNADCLTILPLLEKGSVDAVVTDPPYGMAWNTDTTRFSGGKQVVSRGKDWGHAIINDDRPFDPSVWLIFDRVVLWGSNHCASKLPTGTTLVWIKRNDAAFGSFLSDGEMAWMKSGYGLYCYRHVPSFDDKGEHPTQKPVELMAWCIEKCKTPEAGTVLDPYLGSGTTGVACIRTGRKFLGVEIDAAHFDRACARIDKAIDDGALYNPAPPAERQVPLFTESP